MTRLLQPIAWALVLAAAIAAASAFALTEVRALAQAGTPTETAR